MMNTACKFTGGRTAKNRQIIQPLPGSCSCDTEHDPGREVGTTNYVWYFSLVNKTPLPRPNIEIRKPKKE